MIVIKNDGRKEEFNVDKIINAVYKAFQSCNKEMPEYLNKSIEALFNLKGDTIGVEEIQNMV